MLIIHVNYIIISRSDSHSVSRQFHTKDLGILHYFLKIEAARSKFGVYLSQCRYILDLLLETGMLDSWPVTFMVKIYHDTFDVDSEEI